MQPADADATARAFIAVIESRTFLRKWICRKMQSAFFLPVLTYSTVSELLEATLLWQAEPRLVIFSLTQSNEASVSALEVLLELVPTVPVIALLASNEADLALTVVRVGAKRHIPRTNELEIAIEALTGG